MNRFIYFMTSASGRSLRFLIGLVLIWLGLYGGAGLFVAVIGIVPILASLVNFCLLAPFFGARFFPRRAASQS